MKLNKRLLSLSEMVNEPYDLVWDCCCDHGLLGFKILAGGLIKQLNFVDVVPEITDKLALKLQQHGHHLPADVRWKVLCQDVSEIKLAESALQLPMTAKQLVIISGIGGDLMIDIMKRLVTTCKDLHLDFLLCPVQHTYKLRKVLRELEFKSKAERLVLENKRGYELLLISQIEGQAISLTGSDGLWKSHPSATIYLKKLMTHYQRSVIADKHNQLNQLALDDYRRVEQRYL
ncbi:tRNA (adenine(22)-N(1))-methyltransferase TrmK [Psychromonas sp. GE-S-Ul-11]|uniref:tRNA (adenine(22)-N(1))-methyltransferase TrmK n=1 Tax=Psychromonas sp. GE-S-Ul-11 TaxID=3241170 RepID=UPI00390CA251